MPVAQGSDLYFQNDLYVYKVDKRRKGDLGRKSSAGDGKRADMAPFHRNVTMIDASGELVLLSPLLLRQNMSQSRSVTFMKKKKGRGWEKNTVPRSGVNLERQNITNKARKLARRSTCGRCVLL